MTNPLLEQELDYYKFRAERAEADLAKLREHLQAALALSQAFRSFSTAAESFAALSATDLYRVSEAEADRASEAEALRAS